MQQYKKGNRLYTETQLRANVGKLVSLPAILTTELLATYGFEVYTPPEPTPEEIAEAKAVKAAQRALQIDELAARESAKTDLVVRYLRDHTPAECVSYVQTNVTDLASAKDLLKKYAVILCVLAKQNFR